MPRSVRALVMCSVAGAALLLAGPPVQGSSGLEPIPIVEVLEISHPAPAPVPKVRPAPADFVTTSSVANFPLPIQFLMQPTVTTSDLGTRTSTLSLRIMCVDPGTGAVGRNFSIDLRAFPFAFTGGHAHDMDSDQDFRSDGSPPRPAGDFAPSSGKSGDDGRSFTTVYTAPEVGGVITAQITCTPPPEAEFPLIGMSLFRIGVRIGGLQPLIERGGLQLEGDTDAHPFNHFGAGGMVQALHRVSDRYNAMFGIRLSINDMSLEDGGVFDLGPSATRQNAVFWRPPHRSHRFGLDADIGQRLSGLKDENGVVNEERVSALLRIARREGLDRTPEELDSFHLRRGTGVQ